MNMKFKDEYIKWLYDNTDEYKVSDNVYRITLPFLNRNNDCTEIFIKLDGDKYLLTDDGETINELELSGFNLFSSQKRTAIFNRILAAHGIKKSDDGELYTICSKDNLPQRKHMLSQCMIKISDMFYTAKNNVQSLFLEDVQAFLDEKDIRYTPDVSFPGKSGLTTNYDFAIPKSKNASERIIKVVNNIDQQQTNSIIFLWEDTVQERPQNSELYVFMQDNGKKIPSQIISTMSTYNVTPVFWSLRDKYVEKLLK
mgnify:FL=1|uniref:DUF1828 domain-containing protein n=1 Tax=Myoviridae sp. ctxlX31 TaxID=2827293 RepID=A0A8S5R3Y1_9CAUD|nr:MAG TPA: protein of unknown function DUF1829 [Myoviridae sp. ctxlX31]